MLLHPNYFCQCQHHYDAQIRLSGSSSSMYDQHIVNCCGTFKIVRQHTVFSNVPALPPPLVLLVIIVTAVLVIILVVTIVVFSSSTDAKAQSRVSVVWCAEAQTQHCQTQNHPRHMCRQTILRCPLAVNQVRYMGHQICWAIMQKLKQFSLQHKASCHMLDDD